MGRGVLAIVVAVLAISAAYAADTGRIAGSQPPELKDERYHKPLVLTSEEGLDDDSDGVSNATDTCPATGSTDRPVNPQGCGPSQRDTDGDGVTDNNDTCPATPVGQTVNASGCSAGQRDGDRDGVTDDVDACPALAGPRSNNGCPNSGSGSDSDGDGVPDSSDSCPSQAGPAPSGCPAPPADTDGDGVPDSSDMCDTLAGPAPAGCPDSDGDGVHNGVDACPSTYGPPPTGCPASGPSPSDSDGDGVSNGNDWCPGTPSGVAVNSNGCAICTAQNRDWGNTAICSAYIGPATAGQTQSARYCQSQGFGSYIQGSAVFTCNGNGQWTTNSGWSCSSNIGFPTCTSGTEPPSGGPTGAPRPTVTIAPGPSLSEGNSGTKNFPFTVNLSASHSSNLSIGYRTEDDTSAPSSQRATAGSDYTSITSSVMVPAGSTSASFNVSVNGDTTFESDERFVVRITSISPNQADIGSPSTAAATITNDDAATPGSCSTQNITWGIGCQGTIGPASPHGGTARAVDSSLDYDGEFFGTCNNGAWLQSDGTYCEAVPLPKLTITTAEHNPEDDGALVFPQGTVLGQQVRLSRSTARTVTVIVRRCPGGTAAASDYTNVYPMTLTIDALSGGTGFDDRFTPDKTVEGSVSACLPGSRAGLRCETYSLCIRPGDVTNAVIDPAGSWTLPDGSIRWTNYIEDND